MNVLEVRFVIERDESGSYVARCKELHAEVRAATVDALLDKARLLVARLSTSTEGADTKILIRPTFKMVRSLPN